jgi:DNA-binding winged helix-turn-helix (wHTH) protein
VTSNVVDQYVRYLRHKLGGDLIETVRGVGYRLRCEPVDEAPVDVGSEPVESARS